MADNKKVNYYSPVYVPKKSLAKLRREKMVKSSVLVVLSVSILAVILGLLKSNRDKDNSFVAQAAADQSFADVATYPRLVNKNHPLGNAYVPDNLVSLNTVPNGESVYLRADAAEKFLTMLGDMAADGMAVIPVSGYVSYEEQSALLKNCVDKFIAEGCTSYEAQEMAWEAFPSPGESEAQLGTSVEVSTELELAEKFSSTAQYRWLCGNAYKYGFVVRSADEPWRLRYVGAETAERMQNVGCDLDEYVRKVQKENPSATEDEN